MSMKTGSSARKNRTQAVRKAILGSNGRLGLLARLFLYVMLTSLGFVYIYPILHMGVTSLKSLTDLILMVFCDILCRSLKHAKEFRLRY